MDEALVARVDLKADRAAGKLLVHAAHAHGERPRAQVNAALAQELRGLADWLGLPHIAVARKGELARGLARSMRTVR